MSRCDKPYGSCRSYYFCCYLYCYHYLRCCGGTILVLHRFHFPTSQRCVFYYCCTLRVYMVGECGLGKVWRGKLITTVATPLQNNNIYRKEMEEKYEIMQREDAKEEKGFKM